MGVCETWIKIQNTEHTKSVASKSKVKIERNGRQRCRCVYKGGCFSVTIKHVRDDGKRTIRRKLNAVTYGWIDVMRSPGE